MIIIYNQVSPKIKTLDASLFWCERNFSPNIIFGHIGHNKESIWCFELPNNLFLVFNIDQHGARNQIASRMAHEDIFSNAILLTEGEFDVFREI